VTYYCDDGYAVKGKDERFCTTYDMWSGFEPECGKFYYLTSLLANS